jgi:hypothetical protein
MNGHGVRGFVGQGMNGRRPLVDGVVRQYSAGSHTLVIPTPGLWKFVLWGGGGNANNSPGGGSGYSEVSVQLNAGQVVAIVCGASAAASTVTLPNGRIITAPGGDTGGGSPGAGGAGSGGDVNLSGTAGIGSAGGAAPSNGEFRGGVGGPGNGQQGRAPGGGSGAFTGTGTQAMGATGLVIAFLARS